MTTTGIAVAVDTCVCVCVLNLKLCVHGLCASATFKDFSAFPVVHVLVNHALLVWENGLSDNEVLRTKYMLLICVLLTRHSDRSLLRPDEADENVSSADTLSQNPQVVKSHLFQEQVSEVCVTRNQ